MGLGYSWGYSWLKGACQGRWADGLPSQFDFCTLLVHIGTLPSIRRHRGLPTHNGFAMPCEHSLSQGLVEDIHYLTFCQCSFDDNLLSLHVLMEVVVGLVDMLGPQANLGESHQFQCPTIVLKNSAMDLGQ